MSKIYRHYFRKEGETFSYNKFEKVKNRDFLWPKPYGGFWASEYDPSKDECGWHEWCSGNEDEWISWGYMDFHLKEGSRIVTLQEPLDIKHIFFDHAEWVRQSTESLNLFRLLKSDAYDEIMYPKNSLYIPEFCMNFERMYKEGVDAIDVKILYLYWILYGWDCDSILIMNPDIIIPIGKEDTNVK